MKKSSLLFNISSVSPSSSLLRFCSSFDAEELGCLSQHRLHCESQAAKSDPCPYLNIPENGQGSPACVLGEGQVYPGLCKVKGTRTNPRVLRRTHISFPITRSGDRHNSAEIRKYALKSSVRQKQWTKRGKMSACAAQVHLTSTSRLRSTASSAAICRLQGTVLRLRSGHPQDTITTIIILSVHLVNPLFSHLDTPIRLEQVTRVCPSLHQPHLVISSSSRATFTISR